MLEKKKVKVIQSCPTLCDPMDYTVHGILQARILEWVAFPFSKGSSQTRDRTQVSRIAGGFFTSWVTRETREYWSEQPIPSPGDLPDPGIEPGSPALHLDSLPADLPGNPLKLKGMPITWESCSMWILILCVGMGPPIIGSLGHQSTIFSVYWLSE